jgi:hypothetical protein
MTLQTLSFNESAVLLVVASHEILLPQYVSAHGRIVGASSFAPLRCSPTTSSLSGDSVFLCCSVTPFTTLEIMASYDLPLPGSHRSPIVPASSGFPVSMVTPPNAVHINDSSVLLEWTPVLDFPSPSRYIIFSQRAAFPFVRIDVPVGSFSQWVHGFAHGDDSNFILMGCNMYSSSLQPYSFSCVNSSILRLTITPPPPSPELSVHPLPNCRLLVSLFPVGGVPVTSYALTFSIDGIVVLQVNTSLQNFTSPAIQCAESILIEAAARNLHLAGFSAFKVASAYTQTEVPAPRHLISRVSADSVTFSWVKPHPYSTGFWQYHIRCYIDGVLGCLIDENCLTIYTDMSICIDGGHVVHEEQFTVSRLRFGANVTVLVRSIDSLGFHSNDYVIATGVTGLAISEIYAPVISSAALSNSDCALIHWSSKIPILPSWSYLKMSAVALSKYGNLIASVDIPLTDSDVRLCSISSGMTVSLFVMLNTSIGDQVSSPAFLTMPLTFPALLPAVLLTRWVSWYGASLCIGSPDISDASSISSYDLSCDGRFVAKLYTFPKKATDVAFAFLVFNFTSHQVTGSSANYSCFSVMWPIYVRPSYCSVSVISSNTSELPPSSTTHVKWQPAVNFSASLKAKILGVTSSCVIFDVSDRGKQLQDSAMYVQASQSSSMTNIYEMPPFLLNNSSMVVEVCPAQLGFSPNIPLYFRVYFTNFNIRSEIRQLSTDSPLLNYPVFPRPHPPSPRDLRLQYNDVDFVYVLFWSLENMNSDIAGFQIMFRNASSLSMSSFSGLLLQNQTSFVLNELTKGTRYYFSVHSVSKYHHPPLNPAGSEVVSLSLDSIPDSVSNLIVSSYSDDSITLSWTTVSYPRAAGFFFTCTSSALDQIPISSIVSSPVAIVSVKPKSDGVCYVCACADMMCSRKSRLAFVHYNVTNTPVPVSGLIVSELHEYSLRLQWTAANFAHEYMIIGTLFMNIVQECGCGAVTVFNCSGCMESRSIFSPIIVPAATTSVNISRLTPGVNLFLFVFVRSANGARWIGNTSSVVAATPVPPPQSPPRALALVNISSDSAFIKWDNPQSPDAPTEYRVFLFSNGSDSISSLYFVKSSKFLSSITFQLKYLRLGFEYTVVVKGRNSNIASYNTPSLNEALLNISIIQQCLPPKSLSVVSVTSSSVFVEWEISTDGPEILHFFVFYSYHDVKMVLQPVLWSHVLPKNQCSFNFTGLKTQQTYNLSVATIGYNVDYSSSTASVVSQAQEPFAKPPLNLSLLFANETVFDIAWNSPSLPFQPQYLVSPPPISYEVYVCYNSCMTGVSFPQTARPNDEFVDSFGDLYRWTGLEWVAVLPPVNSYSFVASLNFSTRSFTLSTFNASYLFTRVCAFNLNKQLHPSSANCAYLRNIRVQGLAPTPLLVAGTNPTISTISLNWVVSCPQSQLECLQGAFFVIQYSVFGSGLWTDYPETSTISSMTIKYLHPGTTYIFRVSSVNNAGTSPMSEPSQPSAASTTYNTPKNIRVLVISQLIRLGPANIAVDISWDALPNIASHIFKVEYLVPGRVDWNIATSATNGSRFSVIVSDVRIFDSNGRIMSINGSNLFPLYKFRVTGGTEKYGIDPVDASSSISVNLPALPMIPPSPISLAVSTNTNSSALFVVTAPVLSQPMLGLSSQLFFRAIISSYDPVSGVNGFDDTREVFADRMSYPPYSSTSTFQIDGLVMNATYMLRVQTITANISVVSGFSTLLFQLVPVPGPPLNISVKLVSLNSVTIAWSAPLGAVSGYLLQYSVNSSDFEYAGDVGLSTEGTIRNLPSRTTILVAVRARSLHVQGYGALVTVLAYPTLSCDAETDLELLWANTTHLKLGWTIENPVCIRVQQLQVLSESGWTNADIVLDSKANSSFISCFQRMATQLRRISFSYNPQDLGTVSSAVTFSCSQVPRPVYNLMVSKTFDSSFVLEFDHDVDNNRMSYFRIDTYCPAVLFRSSVVHQVGNHLNNKHVSLMIAQIPNATSCQSVVFHGNSHSSGIENTGTSTPIFSLVPPIEWFPENVSLVGYEMISEQSADVTVTYVLKDPNAASFVGVFLIADHATLIYEESVATAMMQIVAPNISTKSRSCLAILCRNFNFRGYTTQFNITDEHVICVTPEKANPIVDAKIISASYDPVPTVNLTFTMISAAKFVRIKLFKTLDDLFPFFIADRSWAVNNSNAQPVVLDTVSSYFLDFSLQYNVTGVFDRNEPVYMCLQTWKYDESAASVCVRRMLYFTPVNPGAFLSAAVVVEPDRRIKLKIWLSPYHSATLLSLIVVPCSMHHETALQGLTFHTANFSLPYCTKNCDLSFYIPLLLQNSCYEFHSRLYNRDISVISEYLPCNLDSLCKSSVLHVPANQSSSFRSAYISRVFFNNTLKIIVSLFQPVDGLLCVHSSTEAPLSGMKSCIHIISVDLETMEYELFAEYSQNISSQSYNMVLFDILGNVSFVVTLNFSIPSAPLKGPSFDVLPLSNNASTASVSLTVSLMDVISPIRFHAVIWPVNSPACGGIMKFGLAPCTGSHSLTVSTSPLIFSGLAPSQQYCISLRYENAVGWSPWSDDECGVIASSRPFLSVLMVASSNTASTVFVAAKVFGDIKRLSIFSADFVADIDTVNVGNSSFGPQVQWLFGQDDPDRSFLVAVLMDQAELSVNYTIKGFVTVLRPQYSLPFLLNVKVVDENGQFTHQAVNVAVCQSVFPPISPFIQLQSSSDFDLRFEVLSTDVADVIGYEILCFWPGASSIFLCNCSRCKPSTLLLSVFDAQSQSFSIRLSHNSNATPNVAVRTLGFSGHSEFVPVSSVLPVPVAINVCPEMKPAPVLREAYFDQDSGSVMIPLHSTWVNYSANVEISFTASSEWVPAISILRGQFLIFQTEPFTEVMFVRLRLVDAQSCVFFTTSASVEVLPPRILLFPAYDITIMQHSVHLHRRSVQSSLCFPFFEVAYALPCPQKWTKLDHTQLQYGADSAVMIFPSSIKVLLDTVTSVSKTTLYDITIVNSSSCMNWFALRAVCSKFPLVYDIHERLHFNHDFDIRKNATLECEIESYSDSVITAKVSCGLELNIADADSHWTILSDDGSLSGKMVTLDVISVSVHEMGIFLITVQHSHPQMAFVRLQIICQRLNVVLEGRVTVQLIPPPLSPVISWAFTSRSTLRVSWTTDVHSQITLYRVRIGVVDDNAYFKELFTNSSFVDVVGVSHNISYRIFVTARNLHQSGFVFQSETVALSELSIPRPSCLSVVQHTAGGLVVSWCTPESSQILSSIIYVTYLSFCEIVSIDAQIYVDQLRRMAIVYGLRERTYDISLRFRTQDQKLSAPLTLSIQPNSNVCKCSVNVSFPSLDIRTIPCPDYFVKSVKLRVDSGRASYEIPVSSSSFSSTRISDESLSPGSYFVACASEYYSGAVILGPSRTFVVPVSPVDDLKVSFANSSLVSLAWKRMLPYATFHVAAKDRSSVLFSNFSTSDNFANLVVIAGRIYDVWIAVHYANLSSDYKTIAISAVDTSSVVVPVLQLNGIFDNVVSLSWSLPTTVQSAADGMFRYELAIAAITNSGVILPFLSWSNKSNPSTTATIALPSQAQLYAIRLSICVIGTQVCQFQTNCSSGMNSSASACLIVMTSSPPPPPARISLGLFSPSLRVSGTIQVPITWEPSSAVPVLSYRVLLTCDPCPVGSIIQSTGSTLTASGTAVLLNFTTNLTSCVLDLVPYSPGLPLRVELSALGVNSYGYGTSNAVHFQPSLECSDMPRCLPNMVAIASSNVSSITLLLSPSFCGSNFDIEGAINGGGFYPVAPITSGISTPLIQVTSIGGTPYYAPSDFVVFRYSVRSISGLKCMEPDYFNTSSIVFSRTLNFSQYSQLPTYATLQVVSVSSHSAAISITGASVDNGIPMNMILILRDIYGDLIASSVTQRDDYVLFSDLPHGKILYLHICSVPVDKRLSPFTCLSQKPIPVYLHDPLPSPDVVLMNSTVVLQGNFVINSCSPYASLLQVIGLFNDSAILNLTFPRTCPMTIPPISFPFCGPWNTKVRWISAAGPGNFTTLIINVSDFLRPPESVFAHVIIGPFEPPSVRVSWQPPQMDLCAKYQDLQLIGYDIFCTVNGTVSTVRVSPASRSVVLPLGLNVHVGMSITISVQLLQIRDNITVEVSRPAVVNATLFSCDDSALDVVADMAQPPYAPCSVETTVIAYSGPLHFPSGLLVPFNSMNSSIAAEMGGKILKATAVNCDLGSCALLHMPEPGPVGSVSRLCVRIVSEGVTVTWCMKLQFKIPKPALSSSSQSPIFTGLFCEVSVNISVFGHQKLPNPALSLSNISKASMLRTAVSSSIVSLPEGMSIRYINRERASVSWNAQMGQQGFLYTLCFSARYPTSSDDAVFATSHLCLTLSARPCSACLTSSNGMDAVANLWDTNWIAAWISTPPSVLFKNMMILGPIIVVGRNDTGDGLILAKRMGCSISDLMLWNPHASIVTSEVS